MTAGSAVQEGNAVNPVSSIAVAAPRQHHLQQQLTHFWNQQWKEMEEATDFRNHNLPLARIKKIMKADEEVRMISAEAPILFAKACEMFILELTLRSWSQTEEFKRRTLQRFDVAAAIKNTDIFDYLIDLVPPVAPDKQVVPPPEPPSDDEGKAAADKKSSDADAPNAK